MHLLTYNYNDFYSSANNIAVNFREWDNHVKCWKHPYFRTFWQEVVDTVLHFISFDMSSEPLLCVSSDSIWNLTSQPPPRLYYTIYCLHEKESFFFPLETSTQCLYEHSFLFKRVEWMTSKMCFNTRKKESWKLGGHWLHYLYSRNYFFLSFNVERV